MSDASDLQGMLDRLRDGETIEAADIDLPSGGFDAEVLGIVFDRVNLQRVEAHLEAHPRLHQPYGIVHGGVWCSVVETLASVAGALHAGLAGKLCVGVANTTDFLRSHREGRVDAVATPIHVGRLQQLWQVDAVATPIHVGRLQQLWQVELTRAADGKAIARGQVRLQNVDPAQIGG